jgi:hypothetical protein
LYWFWTATIGATSLARSIPVLGDDREAVLQRGLWIRLVQVVEVDRLGPQPTKALLNLGFQHVGPAAAPATLRRDDAAVARGRDGGADCLLALPARIGVGGVDEIDAD